MECYPLDSIVLDRAGELTLHRQLANAVRKLVLSGALRSGQRLPSIRNLAAAQRISRNTVVTAYDQLGAEGIIESRAGAGIWVAKIDRTDGQCRSPSMPMKAPVLSRRGALMTTQPCIRSIPGRPAFHPGTPDIAAFPFKTWSRLLKRHSSPNRADLAGYHELNGLERLRDNIAVYLATSRGVTCSPDDIIVTTGGQAGLDLLSRLLIDEGDTVLIEDPGFHGAHSVFAAAGAHFAYLPVSDDGWELDSVAGLSPRVVYVTPSSQYPLGNAMSLNERLALIDLAHHRGAWIIEDDYDSEHSSDGKRLPALRSLVEDAPVIYVGTFSKTLFPALRLGFLVLPPLLSERLKLALSFTAQYAPLLIQATLADFMGEGHFSTHLNRTRRLYAKRRKLFLDLHSHYLAGYLSPLNRATGLQITSRALSALDDEKIAALAAKRRLNPAPLSSYYRQQPDRHGFVMGYAAIDEKSMVQAFQAFGETIETALLR